MTTTDSSNRAHYMLRRNLPLWKPMQTIEETVSFCRETGIGEIIWKVDAEEFNHGFTPLPMIRDYAGWLERAREIQEKRSIVFSINPWLTQNHIGRTRYADGPPPGYHWRVAPGGEEAPEMACPLGEAWRTWLLEAYRLYATTKPDKLWIEDDFETFLHRHAELGCYCSEHLRTFAEASGEELSRDELVSRLIRPGAPNPLRAKWFDFQGEILVGICREIERTVHCESPATRLGLMQSWSTDGRWWADALRVLAGPHRPLARSSLAPYHEGRALDFLPDRFDILKETACLTEDTENCPELENTEYTAYSKSTRMTRLQLVLSQVLGHRSVTMNLFDMVGSPCREEARMGAMLRDVKPVLDGIVSVMGAGGKQRGVSIPYPKRYADHVRVAPGQGFDAFNFDGEGWFLPLQGSGVPVFLNGDSQVTAITGQSIRAMEATEIEHLLRKALLVDGSAASVLCEMGYAKLIGVEVGTRVERKTVLLSAERDRWAEGDSDGDPVYLTLRDVSLPAPGRLYPIRPRTGGQQISVFVGPYHKEVMAGMIAYENEWGGRVATYPFDFSVGPTVSFMSWRRRRQLQRAVRWLNRGRVDLFVDGGAWMMPVRRDYDEYTLIAVLNFETDGWDEVALTFEWDGGEDGLAIETLEPDGQWAAVVPAEQAYDGTNVSVRLSCAVPALDGAVFRAWHRT